MDLLSFLPVMFTVIIVAIMWYQSGRRDGYKEGYRDGVLSHKANQRDN